MQYLFLTILTITIFLAIIEEYLGRQKLLIYSLLCIALILLAGFRPIGLDPDSEVYDSFFNNIDQPYLVLMLEYSFILICKALQPIYDDVHIVFLFYAIISVTLKFYAIQRMSKWLFLPLVIYIAGYYLLHDFIQMRASVSSGLFLLSIEPLSKGNKKKALLLILLALFFHYSSAILFIVFFLSNKTISRKGRIILASIVPIGIAMYITHIDIITSLPIPFIQEKIENYQAIKDKGMFDEFSLFNLFVWFRIFIFLYSLYFYDTIYKFIPYLPIILKIMGLSVLSFFAFSSLPVFSERINELFGIVELLLFPSIYYTMRPAYISKLVICLIGVLSIMYRLFRLSTFNF